MAKKKGAGKSEGKKAGKKKAKKSSEKPAKKTAKKATKAAKKSTKKTAKRAAKTASKSAKKTAKKSAKKSTKKTEKKATKKTGKKETKSSGKKKTATKKSASTAKPSSGKFSVSMAPAGHKRRAAPGVMIEEEAAAAAPQASEEPKSRKPRKVSAKDLGRIREGLIEKRDQILGEIRHQLGDTLGRMSSVAKDEADRAADVYDGDVSYEMAAAGHHELTEIEAALKKIDRGTYGECETCNEPISRGRLRIIPFATLCARCRQLRESGAEAAEGDSIWGFLDADVEESGEG
jgi:RNA polymerase-binding transcription factor DksA